MLVPTVAFSRYPLPGGRFNRVLHDPNVKYRESLTHEQYTDTKAQQTTMNHFPGAPCAFAPFLPLETSPSADDNTVRVLAHARAVAPTQEPGSPGPEDS